MDSKKVLSIFDEITKIPRESGHEEQITAYLMQYAGKLGLEAKCDEVGNVVIIKEASAGYEDRPVLVLQSHSDMVCEKNNGVEHDFAKDPIKYEIEDGWLIAKDTTLGADCGIGMAAQLAVLESDMPMGKIEALFTVAEETGLDGAKALKPGFITGKVLINLDSEDEGELFVGCAGGIDTTARFKYVPQPLDSRLKVLKLTVNGGQGGHSGDDIDKGRANAVQLLARYMYTIRHEDYALCSFLGGNKRNAIAREASAIIGVPADKADFIKTSFAGFVEDIRAEYAATEPALGGYSEETVWDGPVIDKATADSLIGALVAVAHGVLAMSFDLKGLVETSTNLASVKFEEGNVIRVGTSQRSSVTSARRAAADKVESAFLLAGAEVTHESEYPGWKPNMNSHLLERCVALYEKMFGVRPVVRAIHAGLECGLFLDIYPELDMISFGPTLRGVHAPGEKLDLASLDKFTDYLKELVTNYK